MRTARCGNRGLTLVELLVATGVAAALLLYAVSAMQGAAARVRLEAARQTLHEDLVLAIRHATTLGQRVVVCPATGEDGCIDGGDWSAGWMVFLDGDGDRERSPGERVVATRRHSHPRLRVSASGARARIVIQAGGLSPGSNATFVFCETSRPALALELVIANSGQLRTARSDGAARCPA